MKYKIILLFGLAIISCDSSMDKKGNLNQFIPKNSELIVKINEVSIFKENWQNNSSFNFLIPQKKETKALISLIKNTSESTPILCFTPSGKENFSSILIQKSTKDSLRTDYEFSDYSGFNIKEISVEGISFFIVQINKSDIISNSKLIVENAIRTYKSKQLGITDQDFYKLINNLENKSVFNILLNKNSKSFLNTFLPRPSLFPSFNESWIAFDVNYNSPLIGLDGIAITRDSIPSRLGIFKNMIPKKIKSTNIIPNSFDSFISFPIENMSQFSGQVESYARYYNIASNNKFLKSYSSVDEISILNHNEGRAVILHRTSLNQPIINFENGKNSFRNIFYKKIDKSPKDLNPILDLFKIKFRAKFAISIDEFYILTSKESLVKTIIGSFKDNSTINNNADFLTLMEGLSDLNSGLWVSKTNLLKTNKKFQDFNSKKFPLAAMQWVNDTEIAHLHIRFGEEIPDNKINTVVNQANISSKSNINSIPKWVKNHRSNFYDIVFQDEENTLYLYSNKGSLFWKKELPEKIIGEIIQIDLYKNKKLQMAFRTKNHFMILDRNGKIVKPFDKIIKSKSNALPLSVFDYDNNRNYRFLLAQDKTLLMLNSDAKKVDGFEFTKTNNAIINPVKHVKIKGKDFILVQEANGKLNILNRKGEKVINIKSNLSLSKNPVWPYLNTFTTSDTEGNLVQIDTKGNVIKIPEQLGQSHLLDMTTKTLVSISENIITIKGIPVKLPFGNYTRPKIFYINNTIYVSTTELDTKKVYLFLSNGDKVSGFPVYGSGIIDLVNADNDNSLEMIVKSENDSIIIYQIN